MLLAIYFRGHVGTFPWACIPYLKSASLAILELLPFIAQNVRVTEVSKKISSRIHVGTLSGSTHTKFDVRIFCHYGVILAFNLQIFMESPDPDHAPFYPLLALRGWRPRKDVV